MAEPINEQVNDQNRSGSNKDQLDQRYNKPLESFPPPPYMEPPGQDYRQFQQSTRLHQENVRPPPYSGLTSQSPVQYQAGTQIIYIQTVPSVSRVYKDYNGKFSFSGFFVCLAIAIVRILFSVAMFITVTWGSGLRCKVVCCRSSPVEIAPLMVGGTPLSSTTNRW
ncbi:hypothetical protein LSH36_995g01089 [Paralvinella palmiformis]|uniref:Uncharacterized protein n=1 Tax=Paralvinella palmiformis TaxID=53620 RepID=A0AAD9IXF9_9ANNE|nr:hypothetical protein LSH36_995g01089 [Paralvinella palmiformis]